MDLKALRFKNRSSTLKWISFKPQEIQSSKRNKQKLASVRVVSEILDCGHLHYIGCSSVINYPHKVTDCLINRVQPETKRREGGVSALIVCKWNALQHISLDGEFCTTSIESVRWKWRAPFCPGLFPRLMWMNICGALGHYFPMLHCIRNQGDKWAPACPRHQDFFSVQP